MAHGFERKGTSYVARLDANEREIVVDLMTQTRDLVAPPERESTGDPFADLMAQLDDRPDPQEIRQRDPVLRRLLPDGHRDDPEAADEFRSATEWSLRERKTANLTTAITAIDRHADTVTLDHAQAVAAMLALADVRLALAERIGLDDEEAGEELAREIDALTGPPTDPRLIAGIYYDFLTWLQESLALALMPDDE